jgi:hypothetical protein
MTKNCEGTYRRTEHSTVNFFVVLNCSSSTMITTCRLCSYVYCLLIPAGTGTIPYVQDCTYVHIIFIIIIIFPIDDDSPGHVGHAQFLPSKNHEHYDLLYCKCNITV